MLLLLLSPVFRYYLLEFIQYPIAVEKNHHHIFSHGSQSSTPDSELDHVYAAKHLKFKRFGSGEVDIQM